MGFNRHMRHWLFRMALSALLSGAGVPVAQAASQSFTITHFDSIRMEGPFRLLVTTGRGVTARGEGDRDALDRVELSVTGEMLTVRARPVAMGNRPAATGQVTLYVSTDNIRRIMLSGNGSVQVDAMKGMGGEVTVAGSGDVSVPAVALDRLNLLVLGGGRATLAGMVGQADVRISGAGVVGAATLKVRQLKLTSQGPGGVRIGASETAEIAATGAGDVIVLGHPSCKVAHGGAGQVTCGGMDY